MSMGKRIKQLRIKSNLSQAELGKIAGVTDKAVSTWEQEQKTPRMGAIEKMALYFGVTKSYIIDGVDDGARDFEPTIPPGFEPLPKMSLIPRVGAIACGDPILAEQNIEDYDKVPEDWHADFTLVCEGDSMEPRIKNGDVVAIRKQLEVETGEIAAVRIEDNATLKRVYRYPDRLVLQPENPAFPPIVLVGEEINTVTIEGKAVGLCRNL